RVRRRHSRGSSQSGHVAASRDEASCNTKGSLLKRNCVKHYRITRGMWFANSSGCGVSRATQAIPLRGATLMKMETLRDLYVDELKDLWSAENQILKALPKMIKAATHP